MRSLAPGARPLNLGDSNVNVCSLVGAERRIRFRARGDLCGRQHPFNGYVDPKRSVHACTHHGGWRRFRSRIVANGRTGIRGKRGNRQSSRWRLQSPQRNNFTGQRLRRRL